MEKYASIWGNWERKCGKEFDGKDIHCEFHKMEPDENAEFVVTEKHEGHETRLGIEGYVGAFSGKKPDVVITDVGKVSFADYYTEEGQIVKKLVCDNNKYYMFDFDKAAYYEVISDSEQPSSKSQETFVSKDDKHKYSCDILINDKEKFSKLFLEMFEAIR